MVNLNEARGRIIKDSTSDILRGRAFSSIGMGKMATDSRFVLINMNMIAGVELTFREGMLRSLASL
jgi:hypothetical protein